MTHSHFSSRKPQRRFVAALFDFDETMVDLEEQHDAGHRALCTEMLSSYDELPDSFRFSSGRRIVDDIAEMRSFFNWEASLDELYERRQHHFATACRSSELTLMPGVERTVRFLHDKGLALAVTTSADAASVGELLRRFGIDGCFKTILGGLEVAHGKPDPEAYLVTAAKLDVDVAGCLVFEDSQAGVGAAKAAGMYCVAVRNPRARQLQNLEAANLIVSSFNELDLNWVLSTEY